MTLDEYKKIKKNNKYRAVRCEGFSSKKEAARYKELKFLEKSGVIKNLECQIPYPLEVGGEKVCVYVADFRYFVNKKLVLEDVKGVRTPVYIIKRKLMKACFGIEILET